MKSFRYFNFIILVVKPMLLTVLNYQGRANICNKKQQFLCDL